MCYANNEKQETANDGRNYQIKKKIRILREKETYKYLGILKVDTIRQV